MKQPKKTKREKLRQYRANKDAARDIALAKMLHTREEYEAAAMLLGMKFSKQSLAFYKHDGEQRLAFFHPDTLRSMTTLEIRQRKNNIDYREHPDAKVIEIR